MIQPLWRTVWRFLKKLKIEFPYDPAVPLLGIYPEKTIIRKDTCTPMFTAALFTIARTWKQPQCPLTDKWIKKMWYMYTMEYYSATRKNEIMPFAATGRDLDISILISHIDKDKYYDSTYMWNLKKMIQMNLFARRKQTHRHGKQTYGYQRGRGGIN